MSADPDWCKLHRLIAQKVAKLADDFMKEITAAQGEVPDSDSAEFPASIELLPAAVPSVWGHPDLWEFLNSISKGVIAPRVQKLLDASFRPTERDFELSERAYYLARLAGLGRAERTLEIVGAKTSAVDEIVGRLLGADGTLAFGTQADPTFDLAAAQINAAISPVARQYGSQAGPIADAVRTVSTYPRSHVNEQNQTVAVPGSTNKPTRGRPRRDDVATMIGELRAKKKPWPQIADEVNRKFPEGKTTADACRKLWESRNNERPKNERR